MKYIQKNFLDLTYAQVQKETLEREDRIRELYPDATIVTAWECVVERQIKERGYAGYDPEMRKFFDEEPDSATFWPRDTLYGGKI